MYIFVNDGAVASNPFHLKNILILPDGRTISNVTMLTKKELISFGIFQVLDAVFNPDYQAKTGSVFEFNIDHVVEISTIEDTLSVDQLIARRVDEIYGLAEKKLNNARYLHRSRVLGKIKNKPKLKDEDIDAIHAQDDDEISAIALQIIHVRAKLIHHISSLTTQQEIAEYNIRTTKGDKDKDGKDIDYKGKVVWPSHF